MFWSSPNIIRVKFGPFFSFGQQLIEQKKKIEMMKDEITKLGIEILSEIY